MGLAASLFASVTKVTLYHVTRLVESATAIRDGLEKSALSVSTLHKSIGESGSTF